MSCRLRTRVGDFLPLKPAARFSRFFLLDMKVDFTTFLGAIWLVFPKNSIIFPRILHYPAEYFPKPALGIEIAFAGEIW